MWSQNPLIKWFVSSLIVTFVQFIMKSTVVTYCETDWLWIIGVCGRRTRFVFHTFFLAKGKILYAFERVLVHIFIHRVQTSTYILLLYTSAKITGLSLTRLLMRSGKTVAISDRGRCGHSDLCCPCSVISSRFRCKTDSNKFSRRLY